MSTLSSKEILQQVALGNLSIEEADNIMDSIQSKKQSSPKEITLKASPKGAISFYGLRKMPITLYVEEYEALIKLSENGTYQDFLKENESKLSRKNKKTDSSKPGSEE
jgi:hypothetical protein